MGFRKIRPKLLVVLCFLAGIILTIFVIKSIQHSDEEQAKVPTVLASDSVTKSSLMLTSKKTNHNPPKIRPTPANFHQIKIGMPLSEVKQILGEPWKKKKKRLVVTELTYRLDTPDIIQIAETPLVRNLYTAKKGKLLWKDNITSKLWYCEKVVIFAIFEKDRVIWKDLYQDDGADNRPMIKILSNH